MNTASLVVLGEGLAAGVADFVLSEDLQSECFAAQMARQMNVAFPQRLIQPPGLGYTTAFAPSPVVIPSPLQSTVIRHIPPEPVRNLSVPAFTVADAVRKRPIQPLIHRHDATQTAANLIFGISDIAYGKPGALRTQLELAVSLKPTLALVELGYVEALAALMSRANDPVSSLDAFREDFSKIVATLRGIDASVVVLSIPDPIDTAYCSSIQTAARLVKLDPSLLMEFWQLPADTLITANGLNEMAFQLYAASVGPRDPATFDPLPAQCVLSARAADGVRRTVRKLNSDLNQIAARHGAIVYDLNGLFRRVREVGAIAGSQRLSGDYLGGFYSLNGCYPGATGHALIANEILELLNARFSTSFPAVDVESVRLRDPVAAYKQAGGPNWTREQLASPEPLPSPPVGPSGAATRGSPTARSGGAMPSAPHADHLLRLPPGLEQVLPIDPARSYFGDAISAQHCRTPEAAKYGSGGNLFFGGLAMVDSHLTGDVRVMFSPPIGDYTTFQISFQGGFVGDDSVLAAPTFFKMCGKQQRVGDVPGLTSTGRLNLRTGEVDSSEGALNVYVNFFNSALFALLQVNPSFPTTPLSFPGPYGSASLRFDPRPDGRLDVTFSGRTFVPLAEGTFFPLNFCGPDRQFASIPADGTVLHPHLAFSTKRVRREEGTSLSDIPFNSVQELTLFTPYSSFGDAFALNTPEVGGAALGRSRLLGRVQIQLGLPSSRSVPVAVSTSTAGGLLMPLDRTPLAALFPGRLTPGPKGFDEVLRFPLRTYSLNDLAIIDDPFDIAVGAVDLRSGQLIHELLHRAFINQDLIFALLRVEPRTPQSSFAFRGPGLLIKGDRGDTVYKFRGEVHIPYPAGFLFPDPNLATAFTVIRGGSLDPYLWLWAFGDAAKRHVVKTGRGDRVTSSLGEVFSYRYSLTSEPGGSSEFEYENHTQEGSFRMHSLAWLGFGNSNTSGDDLDTVTFSCFGVWRKGGCEQVVQAAAQISTSSTVPYVGIQISSGNVSNVNTAAQATGFFPVLQRNHAAAVRV